MYTINRNGETIELTEQELEAAFDEYIKIKCYNDVLGQIRYDKYELSRATIDRIVDVYAENVRIDVEEWGIFQKAMEEAFETVLCQEVYC